MTQESVPLHATEQIDIHAIIAQQETDPEVLLRCFRAANIAIVQAFRTEGVDSRAARTAVATKEHIGARLALKRQ